jgi:hypothetical protein
MPCKKIAHYIVENGDRWGIGGRGHLYQWTDCGWESRPKAKVAKAIVDRLRGKLRDNSKAKKAKPVKKRAGSKAKGRSKSKAKGRSKSKGPDISKRLNISVKGGSRTVRWGITKSGRVYKQAADKSWKFVKQANVPKHVLERLKPKKAKKAKVVRRRSKSKSKSRSKPKGEKVVRVSKYAMKGKSAPKRSRSKSKSKSKGKKVSFKGPIPARVVHATPAKVLKRKSKSKSKSKSKAKSKAAVIKRAKRPPFKKQIVRGTQKWAVTKNGGLYHMAKHRWAKTTEANVPKDVLDMLKASVSSLAKKAQKSASPKRRSPKKSSQDSVMQALLDQGIPIDDVEEASDFEDDIEERMREPTVKISAKKLSAKKKPRKVIPTLITPSRAAPANKLFGDLVVDDQGLLVEDEDDDDFTDEDMDAGMDNEDRYQEAGDVEDDMDDTDEDEEEDIETSADRAFLADSEDDSEDLSMEEYERLNAELAGKFSKNDELREKEEAALHQRLADAFSEDSEDFEDDVSEEEDLSTDEEDDDDEDESEEEEETSADRAFLATPESEEDMDLRDPRRMAEYERLEEELAAQFARNKAANKERALKNEADMREKRIQDSIKRLARQHKKKGRVSPKVVEKYLQDNIYAGRVSPEAVALITREVNQRLKK